MASTAGSKGSVVLKDGDKEKIRRLRHEYIYPLDPMTSIHTADSVKIESAKRNDKRFRPIHSKAIDRKIH